MDSKKMKRIMICSIILLVIIALIIVIFLIFNKNNRNNNGNDSGNTNNIKNSPKPTENVILDVIEVDDPWAEKTETLEENKALKLKNVYDKDSYFLIKQCMTKFYESYQNAYYLIDEEAKNSLKINTNNILSIYGNIQAPKFCIDEILKSEYNLSKDVYIVKYRLQNSNNTVKSLSIMIVLEKKNVCFCVYPYEYLVQNGISNVKQNDSLYLNNKNDLERNDYNGFYISNILKDNYACSKELFERCKFDIYYDLENLYNITYEEYKKSRFSSYNDFVNFVKNENLKDDIFSMYKVNEYSTYVQYIVKTESDKQYVFNSINMMEYLILFDNYTVESLEYEEAYKSSFPHVQAQYCIDRIVKAINDKNYGFVYEKLNPVQKNNYYSNIQDFIGEIKKTFYEKNSISFGKYGKVGSNVYQYNVILKNDVENSADSKSVLMTVQLEKDDFKIAIEMK